jgi:hypothetical protein
MLRIFQLLMLLYPADYRAEFGDEMRAVFAAVAGERLFAEILGLMRGALLERCRQGCALASMAAGAVCAFGAHLLMYRYFVGHFVILCFVAGIAAGQPRVQQDRAAMETARTIYRDSMTALREAKTVDDIKRLAGALGSPEFISVDRFGRLVPRQQIGAEFEEILALPPNRRAAGIDILWAEQDAERLIVLAWMMPNEAERTDADGAKHRLMRGTLIRDLFQKMDGQWRRIRHDKLTPNDLVLTVDGKPTIVPPLDERNRITFEK